MRCVPYESKGRGFESRRAHLEKPLEYNVPAVFSFCCNVQLCGEICGYHMQIDMQK